MLSFRMLDPAYCVKPEEHVPETTPPLFSVEDIKNLTKDFIEVNFFRN